ncbi:MAG TPA: helix-turn-helix transcriptional regulator [Cyclobacteriaceae bacterium]
MIKEIKINSATQEVNQQVCTSRIACNDLVSILLSLDKCHGNYCVIIDIVESNAYANYKHQLKQVQRLLKQLTKRESEILQLAMRGKHNKEIANELHISLETVKSHRKKIVSKIGVQRVNDLLNILFDINQQQGSAANSDTLHHALPDE